MNENFDITYKALFRRYYPNLIFYATRLVGEEEAEDVVQDVFVELWKRKDPFSSSPLKEEPTLIILSAEKTIEREMRE